MWPWRARRMNSLTMFCQSFRSMYSGAIFFRSLVHVVVVAERDADRGGGEAVYVVNGCFACPAGHQGALEVKALVSLCELLGLVIDEVSQSGMEGARAVTDADNRSLPLGSEGLLRGALNGNEPITFSQESGLDGSGNRADKPLLLAPRKENRNRTRSAACESDDRASPALPLLRPDHRRPGCRTASPAGGPLPDPTSRLHRAKQGV